MDATEEYIRKPIDRMHIWCRDFLFSPRLGIPGMNIELAPAKLVSVRRYQLLTIGTRLSFDRCAMTNLVKQETERACETCILHKYKLSECIRLCMSNNENATGSSERVAEILVICNLTLCWCSYTSKYY